MSLPLQALKNRMNLHTSPSLPSERPTWSPFLYISLLFSSCLLCTSVLWSSSFLLTSSTCIFQVLCSGSWHRKVLVSLRGLVLAAKAALANQHVTKLTRLLFERGQASLNMSTYRIPLFLTILTAANLFSSYDSMSWQVCKLVGLSCVLRSQVCLRKQTSDVLWFFGFRSVPFQASARKPQITMMR